MSLTCILYIKCLSLLNPDPRCSDLDVLMTKDTELVAEVPEMTDNKVAVVENKLELTDNPVASRVTFQIAPSSILKTSIKRNACF